MSTARPVGASAECASELDAAVGVNGTLSQSAMLNGVPSSSAVAVWTSNLPGFSQESARTVNFNGVVEQFVGAVRNAVGEAVDAYRCVAGELGNAEIRPNGP